MDKKLFLFCIGCLCAVVVISCGSRQQRLLSNEENEIYNLVGDPCAEGDYLTAISRADSILSLPVQMSDSLRACIMIDRDVSIAEYGNLDWGAAYADTIIDFGKRHGVALAVMQGLQNRGIINRRKGNLDKAISDYKEGLEVALQEKDIEMEQVFYEMLAIACAENKLCDEAVSFARRSLDISRKEGNKTGELNTIATIGGIMVKTGDYEGAIRELLPYYELAKESKTLLSVKFLTPLMRSYLSLDSLQKVRETLAETYEALEGVPRNTQVYLVAVNTEAGLAGKEGRYADQWKWFQLADSIGSMGTAPEVWYGQRAECLANLGRYKEAFDMEHKALLTLDSVRSVDTDRRLSELSVKYDTLDKENAIVRLKAQRLIWGIVALAFLLAIAIGIFVFFVARRRALRRLKRERHEEYVKGLEEERARIARELHDDIAGSLVGLQWQLPGMERPDAEKSILDIARRVRSLSHELMPPQFKDQQFTSLLLDYVAEINSSSVGKRVILTDEGSFDWNSISPEESRELYRMVQESVGNALRHGGAGDIQMVLSGDSGFVLTVINNVDPDSGPSGVGGAGLHTLKARAAIIGAEISIERTEEKFTVTISQTEK